MAPVAKYVAKYGDMSLLVTDFTDEGDGRDWVVQSPSAGDQHVLQDRGRGIRRTACQIVFCDEPGAGDYRDRYLHFRGMVDSSLRRLFQHPMRGTYEAACAVERSIVSAEKRCVVVACTFIEAGEVQPVTSIGAGTTAAVGPEAVSARADAANEALAGAGVTSSTPAACVAAVTAWTELTDPNARAIALEAGALAKQIDDALVDLGNVTEWRAWPAYRELVALRYAVVRAAEAVTSETAKVTSITLDAAEPLLSLCARIYPPREAVDRARQVAKLNGLRRPGLVPAGTTLRLPAVSR